jgi:hypothetical protein
MNDMQSFVISAFGFVPLAIIVAVMSKTMAHSICERFLTEDDELEDEICVARLSGLKQEIWRRIDEMDPGHTHGFPARPLTSMVPVQASGFARIASSQFGRDR